MKRRPDRAMSSLEQFQNAFGAALAGLKPVPPGWGEAAADALRVHRNSSLKAAADALAANFPVVRALFGDAAFDGCAYAFADWAPPRDAQLNTYGVEFPGFLAQYFPARTVPYAPDVAALERRCTEALFAADAVALAPGEVAAILTGDGALRLHPAVRFASFSTPAVSIWLAHQAEDPADGLDIEWRPEAALVTRPADQVRVWPLPPGGVEILTALGVGAAAAEALAAALAAGADLPALFSTLITAGAFA